MQENEPFGNYKLLYMAETLSVCEVFIYSFNHQVVTKHIYMLNSVLGPENTSVNKINSLISWKLILVKRTDTNEQICNTMTSRSNTMMNAVKK